MQSFLAKKLKSQMGIDDKRGFLGSNLKQGATASSGANFPEKTMGWSVVLVRTSRVSHWVIKGVSHMHASLFSLRTIVFMLLS